jgi:isopentenyl-diphosphate Delta-isomerase
MALISIVDEDDTIIEYVEISERKPEQIYRVSALWVTNSHGDILIAQRHRSKKHYPLRWWPAVAGTVEKGETYLSNIIKETEEEIWVSITDPTLGPKIQTKTWYLHFTQWFTATLDKTIDEFTLQKDEVEQVRWVSPEKLVSELEENPEIFTPSMNIIFDLLVNQSQN